MVVVYHSPQPGTGLRHTGDAMRFLINNFLKGCLVLVPTVVTIYTVYFVFDRLDSLLQFPQVPIPGLGLLVTVALVTAIGALTSNVVGKGLFGLVERVLKRVPLVNLLYRSLRDFMAALVGEQRSFDRPVVVELGAGTRAFGFVTRDDLASLGVPGYQAVYFPQSINFAGHLLLFPKERVRPLTVDNAELMAFIVSGGVTGQRPSIAPPPA
ncbi:MAG: DUF502 domain-containing protein [Myxococcales bacterium]|nr:DUF502 domain-containing protein [Myxococcales bacterium]